VSAAITSSEVRYFDFEANFQYRAISEKLARVCRSQVSDVGAGSARLSAHLALASPARLQQRFILLGDGGSSPHTSDNPT